MLHGIFELGEDRHGAKPKARVGMESTGGSANILFQENFVKDCGRSA